MVQPKSSTHSKQPLVTCDCFAESKGGQVKLCCCISVITLFDLLHNVVNELLWESWWCALFEATVPSGMCADDDDAKSTSSDQ